MGERARIHGTSVKGTIGEIQFDHEKVELNERGIPKVLMFIPDNKVMPYRWCCMHELTKKRA